MATKKNIDIIVQTQTEKATQDIKLLQSEIKKLQKVQGLDKTTKGVNRLSKGFSSLASHVGKLAIIYGTFDALKKTVSTFASFEQSITDLGVTSGGTAKELEILRQKSLDLGETTIYSATQVSQGLGEMAKAGLSIKEQLAGIETVLSIATNGQISLAEASLLTARAMNSFGLEAKDLSTIGDVMATAITDSAQNINELGEAYAKVAPVSTAFGMSLQETTASLEVLADAGRLGSEAGNQLKIVISRLAGNKEAEKYIKSLGLSMYDANNRLLPFKEQLILLRDRLGQLDEKARNIKLGEIFGEEGKASAIILLKSMDEYDSKLKKINNSYNKNLTDAKKRQDTLKGSYDELTSALDGLAIKIGDSLSPALRSVMEDSTDFILSLDKEAISKFGDSVATLLTEMGALAGTVVSVVDKFITLSEDFKKVTGISLALTMAIGGVIYKLKQMLPFLAALNPIYTALLATAGAVVIKLDRMTEALDNTNKSIDKSISISKDLSDVQDTLGKSFDNLSLDDVDKAQKKLQTSYKDTKKEIRRVTKEIKTLNDVWLKVGGEESQIEALKYTLNDLNYSLNKNKKLQEQLKLVGNKLTQQRAKELKALKAKELAEKELAKSRQKIMGDDLRQLNKVIAKQEQRSKSLTNTLTSMLSKEKRYAQDITRIEAQIASVRKKYANARANEALTSDSLIADLKAKSFNDLEKYNDAQRRADKLLSQAKIAIKAGEISKAKALTQEYDRLIAISAGDEILVNNKVAKSKASTTSEGIKDLRASHKLKMSILTLEENKEIANLNEKLNLKKMDLAVLKAQVVLQKQMITLTSKLLSQAKGVTYNPDFTELNNSLKQAEIQLQTLEKKQRKVKVTVDTKPAETKLEKSKLKNIEVDLEAHINDDFVTNEFGQIIDELETKPVNTKVNLDTQDAVRKDAILITHLSKPVIKRVIVQYSEQGNIQHHKVGGLIQRFQDGGYLNNGIGHTRKAGALSGYGGGDKIKALLEAGEFIIRKEAVRKLGLDRLRLLNQGRLPRFQTGGFVPPIQRFNSGGVVKSNVDNNKTVNINLNLGGKKFSLQGDLEIANSLERHLRVYE